MIDPFIDHVVTTLLTIFVHTGRAQKKPLKNILQRSAVDHSPPESKRQEENESR